MGILCDSCGEAVGFLGFELRDAGFELRVSSYGLRVLNEICAFFT